MVLQAGFEPAAPGLGILCSIHLSYWSMRDVGNACFVDGLEVSINRHTAQIRAVKITSTHQLCKNFLRRPCICPNLGRFAIAKRSLPSKRVFIKPKINDTVAAHFRPGGNARFLADQGNTGIQMLGKLFVGLGHIVAATNPSARPDMHPLVADRQIDRRAFSYRGIVEDDRIGDYRAFAHMHPRGQHRGPVQLW